MKQLVALITVNPYKGTMQYASINDREKMIKNFY